MRDSHLDGIKGILILLVVFGHFLELCDGGTSSALYLIIYSFHMPSFVFLSGYFAKWSREKILKFYLPIYIAYQFIYLVFDHFFIGKRNFCIAGFLTPYWHLWYIFCIIFYIILLPVLSQCNGKLCHFAVVVSILISLLFPMIGICGYFLSIGRFFAFLPFFVLGNFCREGKICFPRLSFLVPVSIVFIFCEKDISARLLYGSFDYSSPWEAVLRCALIIFAIGWISLLLNIKGLPNFLCKIGENTLPIYLLHGFVQRILLKYGIMINGAFTALIISLLLCISLSEIKMRIPIDSIKNLLYNILKNKKRGQV